MTRFFQSLPRAFRPHWRRLRGLVFGSALAVIGIILFQNCGKVRLTTQVPLSEASATPVVSLSDIVIQTTLNHAKTTAITNASVAGTTVSLSQTSIVLKQTLENATVEIDLAKVSLIFTPKTGFRGNVSVTLYVTYGNVTNVEHITFQVVNPVLDYKPALAIRAPECLLCHMDANHQSTIKGDLITDLGYKSPFETGGDFLATSLAYGVAQSGTDSLSFSKVIGSIFVPKVNLLSLNPGITRAWWPVAPAAMSPPATSLADFITRAQPPANAAIDFQGVKEKTTIYIGAPSADDIRVAGGLTSTTTQVFYRNTQSDPEVSGFSRVQSGTFDYYTNSSTVPMVCEGDLFVDGVVFLNRLNLETSYGCRIYATHGVFVNGPITYSNVFALSNLEVVSAVGIFMGFGSCVDCNSWDSHGYKGTNTLKTRLAVINTTGAIAALRGRTYAELVTASLADFAKVSNSLTDGNLPAGAPAFGSAAAAGFYLSYFRAQKIQLVDASNTFFDESGTKYTRLLLNAPIVMSRYAGDFQGTVISEFAMWRLGQFTFTFDPVFTGVPLLPFLDFSKILDVK